MVDVHHPETSPYPITTRDGRPGMARVDTFADVLARYETHPEAKSLGPDGRPCEQGYVRPSPTPAGHGREDHPYRQGIQSAGGAVTGRADLDDLDERITTYDDDDEWYRLVVPGCGSWGEGGG